MKMHWRLERWRTKLLGPREVYRMRLNGFVSSLPFTFPQAMSMMRSMPYNPKIEPGKRDRLEVLLPDGRVLFEDRRA
jgi:hypothetical protein